jgi:phage terminase Nu1 subunit (DNA packaging protein)
MGDKGAGDEGAEEVVRTAGGLARLWCCSKREVRLLAERGIAVRVGHGRYALYKSTQNYIVHLREVAAGRHSMDGTVDAVKASVHAKLQRARLDQLRADMLEEKLISIPEVDAAWAEIMLRIRDAVLSIPGRVRFDLPHMTAFDQRALAKICRDVLEETAEGKVPT